MQLLHYLSKCDNDSVCGCMFAYMHTHLHTAHRVLDVKPGVGTRHQEDPKTPDGLNLGIYVFVYVYQVNMCTFILCGGMRSWTDYLLCLTYFPFQRSKLNVNLKTRKDFDMVGIDRALAGFLWLVSSSQEPPGLSLKRKYFCPVLVMVW